MLVLFPKLSIRAIVFALGIGVRAFASDPMNDRSSGDNGGAAEVEQLSGTVTINFEDFPGGTEIIGQYTGLGTLFGSQDCASGASLVTNIIDFVATTSSPNSLAPCGPAPNNGGTMIIFFSPPVASASGFFVDDQFSVQVTAFAAGDVVVDTDASDGSNVGFDSFSVEHAGGIIRIELEGGFFNSGNPDGWSLDDLTFDPIAIVSVEKGTWGNVKAAYR